MNRIKFVDVLFYGACTLTLAVGVIAMMVFVHHMVSDLIGVQSPWDVLITIVIWAFLVSGAVAWGCIAFGVSQTIGKFIHEIMDR